MAHAFGPKNGPFAHWMEMDAFSVVSVWWKPLADNNNNVDSNLQHHIHIIIIIPFVGLIWSSMLELLPHIIRPTFFILCIKNSFFAAKWHILLPSDICINNSSHTQFAAEKGHDNCMQSSVLLNYIFCAHKILNVLLSMDACDNKNTEQNVHLCMRLWHVICCSSNIFKWMKQRRLTTEREKRRRPIWKRKQIRICYRIARFECDVNMQSQHTHTHARSRSIAPSTTGRGGGEHA